MRESTSPVLRGKKVGILGTGNMGQTLIRALVESGVVEARQLYASNRSYKKLQKVVEKYGVNEVKDPEDLTDICDIIVIATKPQDLFEAVEPFQLEFHESHIVISLAAGISLDTLSKIFHQAGSVARVMPNTPSRIRRGVVGYCVQEGDDYLAELLEELLSPLGHVVHVEEGEAFEALTIAAASGPGFIFEIMQIWQEWLEDHDFEAEEAKRIVLDTFHGTAELAKREPELDFVDHQRQVTSKGGVTQAGLESIREQELERIFRIAFERAVLRDRELGTKLKSR